jgi:hypothetical protein
MKTYRNVYVGIVVDDNDPRKLGRVKVRVQNIFDEIDIEYIPWSSPYLSLNGKSFDKPSNGKIVNVIFENGIVYQPVYMYSLNYNINLQDKLDTLSKDDYNNFIALLFDHRSRIYSETNKLTIDFLVNKMVIDNKSINLEIKDNSNKITLGSEDADQNAVLGQHFIMEWFLEFMQLLIKPTTLTGNLSAPILKPELDAHIQKFLSNPKKFISKNVFISDNNKIKKLSRDSATSEVAHDDTTMVTMDQKGATNVENSLYMDKITKQNIQDEQTKEKNIILNAKPLDDIAVSNLSSGITNNIENTSNINYNSIDEYKKKTPIKQNKVSNSPFSIDKRGRSDELSSEIVDGRKTENNKLSFNPNYGKYLS